MKSELFAPLISGIMKSSGYSEQQTRDSMETLTIGELLATMDFQTKNGLIKPFLTTEQVQHLQNLAAIEKSHDLVLQEQAKKIAERTVFQLKQHESAEPLRQAQLEKDKQTFSDAAKTLGSFSVNDANFNLTRSMLGEGFSTWQIQQAVDSGALQLVPPTTEETEQWYQEKVQAEQKYLKSLDVESLRKVVRENGRRPRQPQMDQVQTVRAAEQQMHDPRVYEPLTASSRYLGQEINTKLMWKISKDQLVRLISIYGEHQLQQRIKGLQ